MIPVSFFIDLHERATGVMHPLSRTIEMAVVPRVGEAVQLTTGGWSERVAAVWHYLDDGAVSVEFAQRAYDGAFEDLAAIARADGWT